MSYLAQDELKDVLESILAHAHLTEREMWVVRIRFGLDTGTPMMLEDVARANPGKPVTRERIRQLEAKALNKIRASLNARERDLSEYDWLIEIRSYVTLLKAIHP